MEKLNVMSRDKNIQNSRHGGCMMAKVLMVLSYSRPKAKREIESLLKEGYTVTLVLWERGWKFPLPTGNGYKIRKSNLDVPFGSLRAGLYFPLWWLFVIYWIFKEDPDIIHATNFDTFIVSFVGAKIKKIPIIYEIADFYADTVNLPEAIKRIIRWLDKTLMKFADSIIISDESRIEQIGRDIHIPVVIINNVRGNNIMQKTNIIRKKEKEFLVFYGGQVNPERGIESIIMALEEVPGVKLIILGYAENKYREKLYKLLNSIKNHSNLLISLEGVPHDKILRYTSIADAIIALYDPSIPNNRYASPNKLFEAMMFGKPIITNKGTAVEKIVVSERIGILVEYGNADSIRNAVLKLATDPKTARKLRYNARRAFNKKYNWRMMEKRLSSLYQNILNHKTRKHSIKP